MAGMAARTLAAYQQALRRNPRDVAALVGIGDCEKAKGVPDPDEYRTLAIRSYKAALKIDPSNVRALAGLAHCYDAQQDSDSATAMLQRIVALRPQDPASYATLAQEYDNDDSSAQAVPEWRTAARLRPADAAYHFALAHDLADGDHYRAAIEEFQQALRLRPGQPDAWLGIGDAWHSLQHENAAQSAWRKAIAAGRGTASASTARDELSNLRKVQRFFLWCAVPSFAVALAALLWLALRAPILYRRAALLPDDRNVTPLMGVFHCGVCLMTLFWALSNQIWRAVWVVVPVYGLAVSVFYGFAGQRRAWHGPRGQTARAFARTHLAWAQAAAWTLLVLSLLCLWLAHILAHLYQSLLGFATGL